MTEDFVLNTLLSQYLDDFHEIPSEYDASTLSQNEVEAHVNRSVPPFYQRSKLTRIEIVDNISESSDSITKEEVFDTLKGLLKYQLSRI
jgi:hypothetical protein